MNSPTVTTALSADQDVALAQAIENLTRLIFAGDERAVEAALTGEYAALRSELVRLLPAVRLLADLDSSSSAELGRDRKAHEAALPQIQGALGDFRLIRELGRGGMGVVYEAEQISLSRRVAVKVLPLAGIMDERQLQRFKNEAISAAALKHPNIVTVYFVGCDRGVHYYAMQFIEGRTLADLVFDLQERERSDHKLSDVGPRGEMPAAPAFDTDSFGGSTQVSLSPHDDFFRQIARFGIQAAEALGHAHDCGVIHRDIKPSNLLINASGQLWVTDFGLARMETSANLTMTGDLIGTLRYMSPEQASGSATSIDHRTDIYSLGATLYELLTLRPVFSGERRQDLLRQIAERNPAPMRNFRPDVPADLETIVATALSKEPQHRYASAAAMAEDLQRFVTGQRITARRPSLWRKTLSWSRRHTSFMVGASGGLAAAMLIAIGLAVLLWQSREQTASALATSTTNLELARDQENIARGHWYVSDIADARQFALQGDYESARALLRRHAVIGPEQIDHRGFEWHYLWQQVNTRPLELIGHQGDVYSADFSPDSERLATAGRDGIVRIWDRASGKLLRELRGNQADVNCVRFHPKESQLITAGGDGTIRFWNSETGEETGQLSAQTGEVVSAAFSPHTAELIVAGGTDGKVRIWDNATRALRHTIHAHSDRIQDIAFSDNGKVIATVCAREPARLWDSYKGVRICTIPVHFAGSTHSIALSPDGKSVVQGHIHPHRSAVSRWNIVNQSASLADFHFTNDDGPESVAWIPHELATASAGGGGHVRLWDLSGGEGELRPFMSLRPHPDGGLWCCRFSPDGRWMVSANRRGHVAVLPVPRDASQIIQLGTAKAASPAVQFSPDGSEVFMVSADGIVSRWRYAAEEGPRKVTKLPLKNKERLGGLAISPDDRTLAVAMITGETYLVDPADANATLRPIEGGYPAFSRDGTIMATTTATHVVITHVATGEVVKRLPGELVASLHFTADGRTLVGCQYGGQLSRWDLPTYTQAHATSDTTEKWRSVASSDDGRFLAGGTMDGSIVVWSLSPSRETLRMKQKGDASGTSSPIVAMAFSADGKTLATCDQERGVHLWNLTTGRELLTLRPLGQSNNGLITFSRDGRHLAAAGIKNGIHSLAVWSISPSTD